MESFRKWLYRPRRDDSSLLAQFYYADEELNMVASELDTFDGSKDPERCTSLVNQLRHCQDKVVNLCMAMMEDVICNERANRDFRAKFPDDVMQDNLAGQLWFGAECLAAGSSILNREKESTRMRPLAKAVTKSIETVRNLLREQCLRPVPEYTEKIRESLKIFDKLFAQFELAYVSAMVPVKSAEEHEMLLNLVVLFSETLQRALIVKLITQDQVDDCDPALMFTIPRLAIVAGLLLFPSGPLNLDPQHPHALCHLFVPFRTLLMKIRELLWTLTAEELAALEMSLCSLEEPQQHDLKIGAEDKQFSLKLQTVDHCDMASRDQPQQYDLNLSDQVEVQNDEELQAESKQLDVDLSLEEKVPLSAKPCVIFNYEEGESAGGRHPALALSSDFIHLFLKRYPDSKFLALDAVLITPSEKRPIRSSKRERESFSRKASRARLRQERLSDRFLAKLTGCEERPRARRRSKRSSIQRPSDSVRASDEYAARRQEYLEQQRAVRRHVSRRHDDLLFQSLSLDSFREAVEPPPSVSRLLTDPRPDLTDSDEEMQPRHSQNSRNRTWKHLETGRPSTIPVVNCYVSNEFSSEGAGLTDTVSENTHLISSPRSTADDEFVAPVLVSIGECVSSAVAADPSFLGPHNLYQNPDLPAPDYAFPEGALSSPSVTSPELTSRLSLDSSVSERSIAYFAAPEPLQNMTCIVESEIADTFSRTLTLEADIPPERATAASMVQKTWRNSESSESSESSCVCSEDELSDEAVALALQQTEVAAAWGARSRYSDGGELVQNLFVCISGVADQLQTNCASDLRRVLKSVFLLNQTSCIFEPEEQDELKEKNCAVDTTSHDSESPSVESAEDALLCCSQPPSPHRPAEPFHQERLAFSRTSVGQESIVTTPSSSSSSSSSSCTAGATDDVGVLRPQRSTESRRSIDDPPPWVPDQEAPRCMACGASFTVLRRRHHCRNCGKVFCSACSEHSVPLPHFGIWKPVRVCNICFLQYVNAAAAVNS